MPGSEPQIIFQVVGEASVEVTKADGTPRPDDDSGDAES